jgi:hypothetical protein
MLTYPELLKIHERLVSDAETTGKFDILDELDTESLQLLLRIAENRDNEIYLYDCLRGFKRTTMANGELITNLISLELHGPAFNAKALKDLPTINVALYHAYLLEAELYDATDVADGVNAGYKWVAERFGIKPNSYRTEWTKVKHKLGRQSVKKIIKHIDNIQGFLSPKAREIALRERAEFIAKGLK